MRSGIGRRHCQGAGGRSASQSALTLCLVASIGVLSACGGGDGGGEAPKAGAFADSTTSAAAHSSATATAIGVDGTDRAIVTPPSADESVVEDASPVGVSGTQISGDVPTVRGDAVRFLARSTFGPTDADIDRLMSIGYTNWINEQAAKTPWTARAYVEAMARSRSVGQGDVMNGIWKLMIADPAQLRIRVGLAWSEIFVISLDRRRDSQRAARGCGVLRHADAKGAREFP